MHPTTDTKDDELTSAQCVAGAVYLIAMLAVLWFSTGSVALVLTVFLICLAAGGAHVHLSRMPLSVLSR